MAAMTQQLPPTDHVHWCDAHILTPQSAPRYLSDAELPGGVCTRISGVYVPDEVAILDAWGWWWYPGRDAEWACAHFGLAIETVDPRDGTHYHVAQGMRPALMTPTDDGVEHFGLADGQ